MARDRLLQRLRGTALYVFAVLAVAFLALPLLPIFPLAFTSGDTFSFPIPGFSSRWFESIADSPRWRAAFANSLLAATIVSVLATLLGVAASLGLTRAALRFRSLILGVIMAPIMVPPIIMAVGMFLLYSQIGLTGTYLAVVLAHTTIALPFVVIIVSSTMARFNRDLLLAAASLGARPITVFRRVLLPLIAPAVLAGAVMAFVQSLDEVIIALLVAGPGFVTIPQQIFGTALENISPEIMSVSVVLIVASTIAMVAAEALRRLADRRQRLESKP